jgi:hypothetical protein
MFAWAEPDNLVDSDWLTAEVGKVVYAGGLPGLEHGCNWVSSD